VVALKLAGTKKGRLTVKEEEAKRMIVSEWYKLPPEQRKTERQVAAFSLKFASLDFKYSGDRYQKIKTWLMDHLK